MCNKADEILHIIVGVLVAWLIIIGVYATVRVVAKEILTAKDMSMSMTVVNCEKETGNHYYTVTVEDADGEQWAYYDDDAKEVGSTLNVVMKNNAIEGVN